MTVHGSTACPPETSSILLAWVRDGRVPKATASATAPAIAEIGACEHVGVRYRGGVLDSRPFKHRQAYTPTSTAGLHTPLSVDHWQGNGLRYLNGVALGVKAEGAKMVADGCKAWLQLILQGGSISSFSRRSRTWRGTQSALGHGRQLKGEIPYNTKKTHQSQHKHRYRHVACRSPRVDEGQQSVRDQYLGGIHRHRYGHGNGRCYVVAVNLPTNLIDNRTAVCRAFQSVSQPATSFQHPSCRLPL